MATTTHGSLATDAAAHLRRSGHTIKGVSGDSQEIDRQTVCLIEWARNKNVILTEAHTAGLKRHGGTTAEHEVFYRASDNRAVKLTYSGTFGVTPDPKGLQQAATPLFYLLRLELMNQIFGSDFKLEGIMFGKPLLLWVKSEQPRMVVSQPWIRAANPNFPHPSKTELSQFMESLGFVSSKASYFGWYRKKDNITVLDARPDNFINSYQGVVPIDLVVGRDCQQQGGET